MMTCAARRSARWIAASRQNQTNAPGVFVYYFNHTLLVIDLFVPDKVRALLLFVCVPCFMDPMSCASAP
jgi:hypothetical protein